MVVGLGHGWRANAFGRLARVDVMTRECGNRRVGTRDSSLGRDSAGIRGYLFGV